MPDIDGIIGLPFLKIQRVEEGSKLVLEVEYVGKVSCPHCQGSRTRKKTKFWRMVRHVSYGNRLCTLKVQSFKYYCLGCHKYFNLRIPGVLPRLRATEPFRREVFDKHHHGMTGKDLSRMLGLGQATIERWYQDHLKYRVRESHSEYDCPMILGIDEHFFTRRLGFATTFVDLRNHRVMDVALGRSEGSLDAYLRRLKNRDRVRFVLMDMSETYRGIVKKYFPNATIIADRFHVMRLVNHQFLRVWSTLDERGRKNRGLLSLFRRHSRNLSPEQKINFDRYLNEIPGLKYLYQFKDELMELFTQKSRTRRQCKKLIPEFLTRIRELKEIPFAPLRTLGETLDSWSEEIVRMWRFRKTNSITEGFHNKMEMISRRAYGFRNFENYRLRVLATCR